MATPPDFKTNVPAWKIPRLRDALRDAERRGHMDEQSEGLDHRALMRRYQAGANRSIAEIQLWIIDALNHHRISVGEAGALNKHCNRLLTEIGKARRQGTPRPSSRKRV